MSFQIQHFSDVVKNTNYLVLQNATSSAKIILNQGASLQELTIERNPIIKKLPTVSYDKSFASSILFPFVNRIKDGKYEFNTNSYQAEINQLEENNALHGFVYNKHFKLVCQNATTNEASIMLVYDATKPTKGFPFTYKIQLEYILTTNTLELKVRIENTSNFEFPFTLGWHPYFYSSDLNNSILKFDASKQVVFDDKMIPIGIKEFTNSQNFELKNKKLDDCFYLDASIVEFETPNYKMELSSSEKEDFLQLFTPSIQNVIAIEPTTGISNSFNNKIGLKTLHPTKDFNASWKVKITNL